MDIMEFRRRKCSMALISEPTFFSRWLGMGMYCVKREGQPDVVFRGLNSRHKANKLCEATWYPPNGPDGRAPDLEAWRAARGA